MSQWWKDYEKFVNDGDNNKIMSMLKKISTKGMSKTCDREGNTLLHYVSRTNNKVIASHLISSGCNINAKNDIGDPPLVEAIINNCTEIIRLLLNEKVILSNTYYESECGPLHKAAKCGHYEAFDMLLKAGCDTKEDANGVSLLHYATLCKPDEDNNSRNKLMKTLIDLGLDVNANTETKSTPLHFASGYGTCEILTLLLNAGAQLEAKDGNGLTPLLWALMYGSSKTVKKLLEAGARIDQIDYYGMTSLSYAVHNLRPEMVKLLLDYGVDVNFANAKTEHPLWRCLKRCCLPYESTKLYRKYCDQFIERDFSQKVEAQVQCLKLLLEYGADVNTISRHTHFPSPITPIYSALFVNHSKIVRLLLKYKATFDFEHKYGDALISRLNSQGSKSINLLLRHTAMFEAQVKKNGPLNFKLEKLRKSQRLYYIQCRDELEIMKLVVIYGSVTFFNILTDSNIERYVRNDRVINAFESQSFKEQFPIYSDLLNDNYQEELERQNMVEISLKNLCLCLRLRENYVNVIFRNVFCYLNKRDLRMLVQL